MKSCHQDGICLFFTSYLRILVVMVFVGVGVRVGLGLHRN